MSVYLIDCFLACLLSIDCYANESMQMKLDMGNFHNLKECLYS